MSIKLMHIKGKKLSNFRMSCHCANRLGLRDVNWPIRVMIAQDVHLSIRLLIKCY